MTELEKLRHSCAHVLADAVKRRWPEAKLTIGPPIESGFYYDFDIDHPFTPEDLAELEKLMQEIIEKNDPFTAKQVTRDEAIAFFAARNEPYKVEIAQEIPAGEPISFHSHGEFVDLCRGGHCERTGEIKAFKLTSVAGAYWRGDSKRKMLQRIYGTAFFSAQELVDHLAKIEEAAKRDHRKLGKELGLIAFHPYAPGAVFWLAKGTTLYQTLSDFVRRTLVRNGYQEVKAPLIFNQKLWETSGHWQNYHDNMFSLVSEEQHFGLKPMNCPGHMLMFGMELRSYRDLPIRLHEQGILHRNEISGTLSGLTRIRQFCQDDGHIFIRPDQIEAEVAANLRLIDEVYKLFGLSYQLFLSTRNPDKFIGEIEVWNRAEASLQAALEKSAVPFTVQEHEAAFYGPKIDIQVTDAIGRHWQCATIQLDYNLPERFELEYVGEDNKKHRPVVIHRAVLGSFERFIALLIEHFAGAFPTWLAPVQAKILPVSEKQESFAREVQALLVSRGLRVEMDLSNDKLGAKIRRAQMEKIPYMVVVGDREVQERQVSARKRSGEQLAPMGLDAFSDYLLADGKTPEIIALSS